MKQGFMKEKILHTKAVYTSQMGNVIAKEIGDITITVDDAANMDMAVKKMSIRKIVSLIILLILLL